MTLVCYMTSKKAPPKSMPVPGSMRGPMRGRPTDPVKVGAVLALYKQGLSYKGIQKETGVKRRTAIDLVHRAKANAGEKVGLKKLLDKENVNPKQKLGCPETVSAREKRYLIHTAE